MNITYDQARQDSSLRQEYLQNVDLEKATPYINKVVYEDRCFVNSWKPASGIMEARVSIFHMFGLRGARPTVGVSAGAFIIMKTEEDFLSTLIDHEGKHAEDMFKNPRVLLSPLVYSIRHAVLRRLCEQDDFERTNALRERRADHAQLMSHKNGERNLSDSCLEDIREHKEKYKNISHRIRARRLEAKNR